MPHRRLVSACEAHAVGVAVLAVGRARPARHRPRAKTVSLSAVGRMLPPLVARAAARVARAVRAARVIRAARILRQNLDVDGRPAIAGARQAATSSRAWNDLGHAHAAGRDAEERCEIAHQVVPGWQRWRK